MFTWLDYLLLFIVLGTSALIGIYYGFYKKQPSTLGEYLFGGRKMKIIPIAFSVTIGHISGIALVGLASDVYKFGAFFWLICFSMIIISTLAIFVYFPVFYDQNVTSIYEYLEQRFDKKCRTLCSLIYILYENLLLPVIAYSPALALSVVTGVNANILTIIICGICIFYTALGGLRTVIWTDIFQFIIIIITLALILTLGINTLGGISNVWNTALVGKRLDIFDFDLDPTKKDSFWICTLGLAARFLYYFCLSQSSLQKYLSLPSFKECVTSILYTSLAICVTISLTVFFGLVIYANYANCDPFTKGLIQKPDQISAFYVMELSKNLPGLNGLFMSTLVCASISTLSSSYNSLSGVIYKDFVIQFLKIQKHSPVKMLKIIIMVQGCVSIALSFLIPYLGDILQVAIGLTGLLDGPSVGLFTLAILCPSVNAQGAFYGTIGGIIFMAIVYIPSTYYKAIKEIVYEGKEISISGCSNDTTFTTMSEIFESGHHSKEMPVSKPFYLFRISYNYYALMGIIVTIFLGLIISRLTRKKRSKEITKGTPLLTVETDKINQ